MKSIVFAFLSFDRAARGPRPKRGFRTLVLALALHATACGQGSSAQHDPPILTNHKRLDNHHTFPATFLYQDYSSSPGRRYDFNCDFSDDEMQVIRSYSRPDLDLKPTDSTDTDALSVSMGRFGTLSKVNVLVSHSYATCSGVSVINAPCRYGSLSHFSSVNPVSAPALFATDLKQNCRPDHFAATHIFFLISRYKGIGDGLDDVMYRKLLCDSRSQMPFATLHIFFAEKKAGESNDISIIKRDDKIDLELMLQRNGQTEARRVFSY